MVTLLTDLHLLVQAQMFGRAVDLIEGCPSRPAEILEKMLYWFTAGVCWGPAGLVVPWVGPASGWWAIRRIGRGFGYGLVR